LQFGDLAWLPVVQSDAKEPAVGEIVHVKIAVTAEGDAVQPWALGRLLKSGALQPDFKLSAARL
jgi:hypothetical protein